MDDNTADPAGRSVAYVAVDRTLAGYLIIANEVKNEAPLGFQLLSSCGIHPRPVSPRLPDREIDRS